MDTRSDTGRLTSFRLNLLFMLLVFKVNTAICQVNVQAFIGDTVLLPCIYSQGQPVQKNVFWRDKDDSVVLDIIKDRPDLSTQNEKFRQRVVSFPDEFVKGNFSIQLKDVQQADSSPYECHIPSEDFQERLVLTVSGKRVEATPGPSGGAAGTPNPLHILLLCLPLSLSF
ncbi:ICOS ligand-like [Chaetodon trifascialis]|uniref:ICOS ligand-like n=1 Tax=Chaetodon trifascialis TaxID=109706 RepID=UPI003991CC5D